MCKVNNLILTDIALNIIIKQLWFDIQENVILLIIDNDSINEDLFFILEDINLNWSYYSRFWNSTQFIVTILQFFQFCYELKALQIESISLL